MAYTKIVVGTDGSETSLHALKDAARLAKTEGAELIVVHAGSSSDVTDKAKGVASREGVEADIRTQTGEPADVLLSVVEAESADLLVVGNKGMTGSRRFVMGSVPNKVSHHAPCDLLIVRTT